MKLKECGAKHKITLANLKDILKGNMITDNSDGHNVQP